MDIQAITLATLADGVTEELFQAALARVLENIHDPNTDHKVKRSITLTLVFGTEDEERKVGSIDVRCATKLAGVKGHKVGVYFGRHEGVQTVVESPRQESLFPNPAGRPHAVAAAGGPPA